MYFSHFTFFLHRKIHLQTIWALTAHRDPLFRFCHLMQENMFTKKKGSPHCEIPSYFIPINHL